MSGAVRVRFAPSPTGPLHLGGVRTALYNYLLARQTGGNFILRIEDTDQNRYVPGAEEYIIEALKWAGISPDEGVGFGDGPHTPYRQSERKHMYKAFADKLLENGWAYLAFDSAEELDAMRDRLSAQGIPNPQYNYVTRQYMKNSLSLPKEEVEARLERGEPHVLRFKMPRNEEVKFHDEIRGWVVFNTSQLDDKVLFKSDGMPTYHLANVADDYMMKITHVIRGEEWLSSAPLHVLLYRALGIEELMPKFAHLSLILKPEGNGKLSKRDGDRLGFPVFPLTWKDPATGEISIGYRERGFLPAAFINFLALLGWNPGGDKEIMDKQELTELFSLEKVHKAGARFDYEKAKWFNQQHLKAQTDEWLVDRLREQSGGHWLNANKTYAAAVIALVKERAVFLQDLNSLSLYFFEEVQEYDEEGIRKKWTPAVREKLQGLPGALRAQHASTAAEFEQLVGGYAAAAGLKTGEFMPVMRLALAGSLQGPPVYPMMEVLGKDRCAARLEAAFPLFDKKTGI